MRIEWRRWKRYSDAKIQERKNIGNFELVLEKTPEKDPTQIILLWTHYAPWIRV